MEHSRRCQALFEGNATMTEAEIQQYADRERRATDAAPAGYAQDG